MAERTPIDSESLFRVLTRTLLVAAGLWLLISFLKSISLVILLFVLAIILFLAANPLVTKLERKGASRALVAIALLIVGLIVVFGMVLLIAPQFGSQFEDLVRSFPTYVTALSERAAGLSDRYPRVAAWLQEQAGRGPSALERVPSLLSHIGTYTLGAVTGFVFLIILIAMVIYMLSNPRPQLKGLLALFPEHLRDPMANAFSRSETMVVGWVRSNLVVGGVEGTAAGIFLTLMGVPGAIVWGVLGFFAELIPKIGPYLQIIPPVLLALTISPMTALWVLVFYLILQELTGDLLAPKIRGAEMQLHPVSIMFGVLAMTIAFGFLGAIIATPMVGILKVFYEEFYLKRYVRDPHLDKRVERMLRGETTAPEKA
ncbi:MAG: AI-2E family transporter [Armatimonadota bacterium]